MDMNIIVRDTVCLLAPALPYLLELGKEAAKAAAKKLGEAAWEKAKALWEQLRPSLDKQPGSDRALAKLAESPDDGDAQGALRMHVCDALEANPDLVKALQFILEKPGTVAALGERSVAIGGSANGAVIITGNDNTLGTPRKK